MRKILASLFTLIIILFGAKNVYANTEIQNIVTLPASEVYEGDFYAFGEVVQISGIVDGDVYAAGSNIIIDGEVTGDVIAAGENILISGVVGQNARVAGFDVEVTGEIGRNLSVAGANVNVANQALVKRNVQAVGDQVLIDGAVDGEIQKYTGENMPRVSEQEIENIFTVFGVFASVVSLISTLVLGLIIVKLFPNYTEKVSTQILKNFWKSALIGFAGLVLFPIAIVLLVVTIFAIPLAIVLGCLFVFYLYITNIFAMYAVGNKLIEITGSKITNKYWKFVIGMLAYTLLGIVPIIGGIIKFFVMIASLGATLINEKANYALSRKEKIF